MAQRFKIAAGNRCKSALEYFTIAFLFLCVSNEVYQNCDFSFFFYQ